MKMNIDLIWQKFLQGGDDRSFSAIYNEYVDELYSYGIQWGFRDEICKDAIQDVFYKMYISRNSLKQIKNPAAYLLKSYRYRLIDILRKEVKTQYIDLSDHFFISENNILEQIIDAEESNLLKSKVEKLLNRLSGQQREALYMKFSLGLGYDEIGEILNINSDSVKKLIYRTMKKLREQF
ncbi:MAG: RNA polymerase sigma factor [Tannerella sp.]|uniref:RNA polymerase sigma factor n=1 Tax=Tannerella sp. TaxID=2382127 RepID=UPI003FA29B14